MKIEKYSFDEFKSLVCRFHGYAAPGVLLGGYMVALAKRNLPAGTLFEVVSETAKCLPDAVQLLSLCSMGNQRVHVRDLGRYAITLYDKYTGQGVRVSIDLEKLRAWPEYYAWIMKLTPKKEQDESKLLQEIETAGDSICRVENVSVLHILFQRHPSVPVSVCPLCGEGYPADDGPICRGCQGENYFTSQRSSNETAMPVGIKIIPSEQATGKTLAHDMTGIIPGKSKGPAFTAGQTVTAGDLCRLQQIGRFEVAVLENSTLSSTGDFIHENEVAEHFAAHMAGPGVRYTLPPREGKIDFIAEYSGLLSVDVRKLEQFNLVPKVICASRQDATLLQEGEKFAGTRAIPLFLKRHEFSQALRVLGKEPLFKVTALRSAKMGILVTGTEVFNGLIEDQFIPVMSSKARQYHCEVLRTAIVPDDKSKIVEAVQLMIEADIDILVTTGGMSVDPGDVTRPALLDAGLTNVLYGMPVLPGAMALIGHIKKASGSIQVIGVPACALFFKNTVFDLLMPRLLADRHITRSELARMGEGGYCCSCPVCTFPHCGFGK